MQYFNNTITIAQNLEAAAAIKSKKFVSELKCEQTWPRASVRKPIPHDQRRREIIGAKEMRNNRASRREMDRRNGRAQSRFIAKAVGRVW